MGGKDLDTQQSIDGDTRFIIASNTKSMTTLVCACTGLPRKDLAWVFNNSPDTPTSAVAAHVLYPDMEMGAAYASCDAGVYF